MTIIWKPVPSVGKHGQPLLLKVVSDGLEVLNQIKLLPKKEPISYERAVALAWEDAFAFMDGVTSQPSTAIYNIPFFISSLGYHIELRGDEYDIIHAA